MTITKNLKPGNIVSSHGMKLKVIEEPSFSKSHSPVREVYYVNTEVLNIDEVKAEGFVPLSFLYPQEWGPDGWFTNWDAIPTWLLQGNSLVSWRVIS